MKGKISDWHLGLGTWIKECKKTRGKTYKILCVLVVDFVYNYKIHCLFEMNGFYLCGVYEFYCMKFYFDTRLE